MSYLDAQEAASVQSDSKALIESTGEDAQLYHGDTPSGVGSFGGPGLVKFTTPVETVSVLAIDKKPDDLLQVDHDYILMMCHDQSVKETDELVFRGSRFVVVDINLKNLFGVVSHKQVAVKKLRGA